MLDKGSHLQTRFTDRYVPTTGQHMHMPREEFMKLLGFAGFQCCHICQRRAYLLVDHNHVSPWHIRGLVCNECNIKLGTYERGGVVPMELARAMQEYLKNPPANQLGIARPYRPYYPEQCKTA